MTCATSLNFRVWNSSFLVELRSFFQVTYRTPKFYSSNFEANPKQLRIGICSHNLWHTQLASAIFRSPSHLERRRIARTFPSVPKRTNFNNRFQLPIPATAGGLKRFLWFKTWQDGYILATSYNLAVLARRSHWLVSLTMQIHNWHLRSSKVTKTRQDSPEDALY